MFVFAVTQLSHGLLAHLTLLGALETGLLMMAVWSGSPSWITLLVRALNSGNASGEQGRRAAELVP